MGSGAAELERARQVGLSRAQITARRWQLTTIAVIIVTADQITKAWAVRTLEDGPLDGPFGSALRLVYNTGSAFSLGTGFGPLFGVIGLLVALAMFWVVRNVRSRATVAGLALLQGGAGGNLLDRIFRDGDGPLGGPVIDFLEVGSWWPVFNLADIAIVCGGAVILIFGTRG